MKIKDRKIYIETIEGKVIKGNLSECLEELKTLSVKDVDTLSGIHESALIETIKALKVDAFEVTDIKTEEKTAKENFHDLLIEYETGYLDQSDMYWLEVESFIALTPAPLTLGQEKLLRQSFDTPAGVSTIACIPLRDAMQSIHDMYRMLKKHGRFSPNSKDIQSLEAFRTYYIVQMFL